MYKALYRSYRPQDLEAVVGQDHIVKTLRNSIEKNKIAHAYLFSGPRGTGKTSIAHIFSKLINTTASGEVLDTSMDVIEIDAASNNGVQEVRNIIDNTKFPPSHAKYKVYIIDEVHMLTKSAWNALLKILEEPPQYVVFVLATTEAHKIPITILSRTQRFNFKRIDTQDIVKNLEMILSKEGIKYDNQSLYLIAKIANGGMRDAISIADQVSAYGNGHLTLELVSQIFGVMSITSQIQFINQIYKSNVQSVIKSINDLFNEGIDLERLIHSMLGILKDYIIMFKTNDVTLIHETSQEDLTLFEISEEFAYLLSTELIQLLTNLRTAELPKNLFELSVLKFMGDIKSGVKKDDMISITQEIARPKNNKEDHAEELKIDLKEMAKQSQQVAKTAEIETPKQSTKTVEIKGRIETKKSESIPLPKDATLDDIQRVIEGDTQTLHTGEREFIEFDVAKDVMLQLLMQSDRQLLTDVNGDWELFEKIYKFEDKYTRMADRLTRQKVIAAGRNYIIVSSQDDSEVIYLQDRWQDDRMQELMSKMFGNIFDETPVLIPIIAEEFKELRETYSNLKTTNKLPAKNEKVVPKYKNKLKVGFKTQELLANSPLTKEANELKNKGQKTEDEELKEIFGDKFK